MTTAELTDHTVYMASLFGVILRRNAVDHRGRTKAGIADWPDLIGYDRAGRFWAIEVKNRETKDRMRPGQLAAMRQMIRRGCQVHRVQDAADVEGIFR